MFAANSVMPFDHWPNYLKLSMKTGTPQELPLSKGLNSSMAQVSLLAGAAVLPVNPRLFSNESIRLILNAFSFQCNSLEDAELWELYNNKEFLLKNWGKPSALLKLSEIYLGPAELLRGHDFSETRLSSMKLGSFRLSKTNERANTLIFLIKEAVLKKTQNQDERVRDFLFSARSLCPANFKLAVKFLKAEQSKESYLNFKNIQSHNFGRWRIV